MLCARAGARGGPAADDRHTRFGEAIWLEPFPDVLLEGITDYAPGPEARYEEPIALVFTVGLQHLPPQQRTVLVTRRAGVPRRRARRDARDHRALSQQPAPPRAYAIRVAAAVSGRDRAPLPNSKLERDIVGRFADAIQPGDTDTVVGLLSDDAWLTMPPEPYEYQGSSAIGRFLRDRTARRGAPRVIPTRANTRPTFGCYFPSPSDRDRTTVRDAHPHAGRRSDRRHHLVRRQQRVPVR